MSSELRRCAYGRALGILHASSSASQGLYSNGAVIVRRRPMKGILRSIEGLEFLHDDSDHLLLRGPEKVAEWRELTREECS